MLWTWKIHVSKWIERTYGPGPRDVLCIHGRDTGRKELRHRRVMEGQISKFNRLLLEKNCKDLGGHSNHQSDHSSSNKQGPERNNSIPKKWVINLSSNPLTQEQESLLAHGPNFVVTSQKPPYGEYITSIEKVCQSLDSNTAEELISGVYRVLRQPHQLKSNL